VVTAFLGIPERAGPYDDDDDDDVDDAAAAAGADDDDPLALGWGAKSFSPKK
jgi:hypothetical protein